MAKPHWHIIRETDALTVARRLPVRFDICAEALLPMGGLLRMATQIRQDMWRALQNLRGFSPAVRVVRVADGLHVQAGGQVDSACFPQAQAENVISRVLSDSRNHVRWYNYANRGQHG